jgi:hypothetical protein
LKFRLKFKRIISCLLKAIIIFGLGFALGIGLDLRLGIGKGLLCKLSLNNLLQLIPELLFEDVAD